MKLTYEHKELFEQLIAVANAAVSHSEDPFDAIDEFEIWVRETYENVEGFIDPDITRLSIEKKLNEILELINSQL